MIIVVISVVITINSLNKSKEETASDIVTAYNVSTTESTTAETTTQKVKLSESCDKILASGTYEGNTYELVATQEETYNDVVIKVGVIKNNEWLVPLTTDSPFINEDGSITYKKYKDGLYDYYHTKNIDDLDKATDSYYFVGNGCFFGYSEDLNKTIASEYPIYEVIYNVELDKTCKTAGYSNSYGSICLSNAFCIKTIGDENINSDKIVFHNYEDYYDNDFDVKVLDTNSMITKTIIDETTTDKWSGHVIGPLSNGLFAVGDSYDITAFYDEEGNKVIDMSEYDVDIYNYKDDNGKYPYFENGQFKFVTTNEAGNKYNMIIDKTGKVLSSIKQ